MMDSPSKKSPSSDESQGVRLSLAAVKASLFRARKRLLPPLEHVRSTGRLPAGVTLPQPPLRSDGLEDRARSDDLNRREAP
jgi:hypothetical protein